VVGVGRGGPSLPEQAAFAGEGRMHRLVRLDAAHLRGLDYREEVAVGLLAVGRGAEPARLLRLRFRLAEQPLCP